MRQKLGSSDSKVLLQHLRKNGFLAGDTISQLGDMTEDAFRGLCHSLDVINAIAALDDSWLDPLVSFLESRSHPKVFVQNVRKKIVSARISSLNDLSAAITPLFILAHDLPHMLVGYFQDSSVLEKLGIAGATSASGGDGGVGDAATASSQPEPGSGGGGGGTAGDDGRRAAASSGYGVVSIVPQHPPALREKTGAFPDGESIVAASRGGGGGNCSGGDGDAVASSFHLASAECCGRGGAGGGEEGGGGGGTCGPQMRVFGGGDGNFFSLSLVESGGGGGKGSGGCGEVDRGGGGGGEGSENESEIGDDPPALLGAANKETANNAGGEDCRGGGGNNTVAASFHTASGEDGGSGSDGTCSKQVGESGGSGGRDGDFSSSSCVESGGEGGGGGGGITSCKSGDGSSKDVSKGGRGDSSSSENERREENSSESDEKHEPRIGTSSQGDVSGPNSSHASSLSSAEKNMADAHLEVEMREASGNEHCSRSHRSKSAATGLSSSSSSSSSSSESGSREEDSSESEERHERRIGTSPQGDVSGRNSSHLSLSSAEKNSSDAHRELEMREVPGNEPCSDCSESAATGLSSLSVDGAASAELYDPENPAVPELIADKPPNPRPALFCGMADESNFWADFASIESQGVAMLFADKLLQTSFYFGTVTCADDKKQTVSIHFNDDDREDDVSIIDPDLVFLRGEYGMICLTCAGPDADLICKDCKASFHFNCIYSGSKRRSKPKVSKPIKLRAWMSHGCTPEKSESEIECINKTFNDDQLSEQHCALCGQLPIVVQTRKAPEADKRGVSQCEHCKVVHCWSCSGYFLENTKRYACFRCMGGINKYNQALESKFLELAELVEKEISKWSRDKSRGVGAGSKAAAKRKARRTADNYLESPVFVSFANSMMHHQRNLDPLSFPKHFDLFLRMILYLLEIRKPVPITPYDVLRIMGFDRRVTLEMLILVSQQTILEIGVKDLTKFSLRAMSSTGILRIGILSGDFGGLHPTPNLLRCLFDFINRSKFSLTVFSRSNECPEVQADLLQRTHHPFISFGGEASDDEIAFRIREREIDFLFDINGHTHGGSPKVLARWAAPVQIGYLGYAGVPHAPECVSHYITDDHVVSRYEASRSPRECPIFVSCCQGNAHRLRYPGAPEITPISRLLAMRQERLPTEDGVFVFFCLSDLSKLGGYTFLKIALDLLNKNSNSVMWLLSEPAIACENVKQWLTLQGNDCQGKPWIDRFFFAQQIPKELHLKRIALGSVAMYPFPYSAHTVAIDNWTAGRPGVSVSIPEDDLTLARWASNVPGSIANALHGPGNPWVTWSFFEQSQVLHYFAQNPSDIEPWVERTIALKKLKYSIFGEHHVREIEQGLHILAEEYIKGEGIPRREEVDAKITMKMPPPPKCPLPNPLRIDMMSSKRLGRLERLAMGLSLRPSPDSGTLFELDSARFIFSLFQATSDHETKCLVDVSGQSILAELASSMEFQQCFAIWPMDRISYYLDYVRPRLDEKRLLGKEIGFSFYDRQRELGGSVRHDDVDRGFFFDYPRNAQLLVLSVSDSEVYIWKNTLELIKQKNSLGAP